MTPYQDHDGDMEGHIGQFFLHILPRPEGEGVG